MLKEKSVANLTINIELYLSAPFCHLHYIIIFNPVFFLLCWGLVQRERTGKLTLRDLMIYFHLPIEEAARRMKLCPTVVKKICRRDGLHRWPHRKV